ncbi:hypothetical protein ASPVEDRAFT_84563 [Aspergillus versicolor CBS 583.65]|uniref:BTB domain-containing protein n=1 Tax=Aspergillus versicolor CBS 583.65 TaxID=1036611 RepID=A0A1L9PNJ6_ASPVE|nr:uncharacterized protein ASPVEDRAFT_84563 [Aspergillus versicolor CBS 583.65]OJJ03100.1 hypothetical protein ASPVEDRAFT_84563 [Aspergillus versicolor CBS 583.65]
MFDLPTPNGTPSPTGAKPKETLIYTFDPQGDVTLVLDNAPNGLPARLDDLRLSPGGSSYFSSGTTFKILRIQASSKHLALACPYFSRMLRSKFSEGAQLQSQGNVEINIHEPRVPSFVLLMCIVHCRMQHVPTVVPLSTLSDMAALVDYYECYDAVGVFADLWIRALENQLPTAPELTRPASYYDRSRNDQENSIRNALNWVLISWVFYKKDIFQKMTQYLQDHSVSQIITNGLPIPAAIIGKLNNKRTTYIQMLIDDLNKLHSKVAEGCINNSTYYDSSSKQECTYLVLGALTKRMMEMKLVQAPAPQSPFLGFGINKMKTLFRDTFKSPNRNGYHERCQLSSRITTMLDGYSDPLGFDIDDPDFPRHRNT